MLCGRSRSMKFYSSSTSFDPAGRPDYVLRPCLRSTEFLDNLVPVPFSMLPLSLVVMVTDSSLQKPTGQNTS